MTFEEAIAAAPETAKLSKFVERDHNRLLTVEGLEEQKEKGGKVYTAVPKYHPLLDHHLSIVEVTV